MSENNYFTDIEIPDSFFADEFRDNYYVSKEIKKVWAVQLRLLHAFSCVCRANNLKWWAAFGTLIGAVRHKGMIPWDDDIDVIMPRDDYEMLRNHPEWFPPPMSLHMPNFSERYYEGWLRLHDEHTAVLYPNYKEEGANQGIYIDVFPLDYLAAPNREIINRKKIRLLNVIGHAYSYNVNPNIVLRAVNHLDKVFEFINPQKIMAMVDEIAQNCKALNNSFWGVKVCSQCDSEKMAYPVTWFEDTIELQFEMLTVNAPVRFDEILHKTYGDYMQFPPVEKRGCWHNFRFDTEQSYMDYAPRKSMKCEQL